MPQLFSRQPRVYRRHLFDDLPFEAQREAMSRYWRYCQRWGKDLPGWRRAILIGQARRWAMTSQQERSQLGRTMLAMRGGYAVQRLYREQGRIGDQHPAHKAAAKSVENRKGKSSKRALTDHQVASPLRHKNCTIS